jgi:hypothetical protein
MLQGDLSGQDTLSLTHSKIHAWRPHCCRRQNHTRFFYDFISCLRATSISLPNVAGHRSTRRNCVRPHKSVWHTDLTTQHVYPTVKVTKQVQDMHVARTVIPERGPSCACRQHMAVSFPSLSFVSSLAFGERKSRGWTMFSALFRGGVHNEFFLPGSRKSMCSSGQIFKNVTVREL